MGSCASLALVSPFLMMYLKTRCANLPFLCGTYNQLDEDSIEGRVDVKVDRKNCPIIRSEAFNKLFKYTYFLFF